MVRTGIGEEREVKFKKMRIKKMMRKTMLKKCSPIFFVSIVGG